MCDSLLTSTLLTTLQSRCYGSLGSSYYMFELTSSPYEWKEFVYQGILDFVYLKEYKSRLTIEHRTLVSRFATRALMHDFFCKCIVSLATQFATLALNGNWSIYFHSLVEWSLVGLKKEEIGKLCLFSHDVCGCWKQLISRLLPQGTKGWGRIERYVS
jgi:hypothetical protein